MTAPTAAAEAWGLVAAARAGDQQAFAELYVRYQPAVRRRIIRLTGDPQLADDLAQETFARALRGLRGLTYQGSGDPGRWLMTIVRNLVIDHRTSACCQREVLTAELPDPGAWAPGPETLLLAAQTSAELARRVATLPAAAQQILYWRYVAGLPLTQIAHHTGRTTAAVKSALCRARSTLAARIVRERLG